MARKAKAKETIPAVEVGAEVLEKSRAAMDELIKLGQEFEWPDKEHPPAQEWIDEFNKGKISPISPSESITDVLEEKATVVLPEGENASSEATDSLELITEADISKRATDFGKRFAEGMEIAQKESLELIPNDVGLEVVTESPQQDIKINLKHVDLNSLVKDILYISSLGGEIPFGNYTNLRKFPYQAEMTLPYAAKEAWENRPEESPHEKSYTVNLSYLDANIFANKLVELGKKGAKLDGGVLTTGMMQAKLKMFVPIAEEKPNVTVGLDKFRYTREELHLLDYVSLKALGSWYGVRVGAKAGLIKAILDKQAEVNWV